MDDVLFLDDKRIEADFLQLDGGGETARSGADDDDAFRVRFRCLQDVQPPVRLRGADRYHCTA